MEGPHFPLPRRERVAWPEARPGEGAKCHCLRKEESSPLGPPKSPSPGGAFGTAGLSRQERGGLLHSAKVLPKKKDNILAEWRGVLVSPPQGNPRQIPSRYRTSEAGPSQGVFSRLKCYLFLLFRLDSSEMAVNNKNVCVRGFKRVSRQWDQTISCKKVFLFLKDLLHEMSFLSSRQ